MDLIDRQAAIDAMEYWFGIDASEAIERLPSAQPDPSTCWGCNCQKMDFEHTPERKKGKWIVEYQPNGKPYCLHCSVCDGDGSFIGITTAYNFCPNCGAKMGD